MKNEKITIGKKVLDFYVNYNNSNLSKLELLQLFVTVEEIRAEKKAAEEAANRPAKIMADEDVKLMHEEHGQMIKELINARMIIRDLSFMLENANSTLSKNDLSTFGEGVALPLAKKFLNK